MSVISFHFAPNIDRAQQDRVLDRLKKMSGVHAAGRIDPESNDHEISRMCFAESVDAQHALSIIEELRWAKEVQGVSLEARREPF